MSRLPVVADRYADYDPEPAEHRCRWCFRGWHDVCRDPRCNCSRRNDQEEN